LTGKYRLKARAERQEATRRQIVDAAVDLHTTLGPAHTTDAAIAERAGVTRVTFYRHFPDELSLFRACMSRGLVRWPPPDPSTWRRVADPVTRLRLALTELYAYYSVTGPGLAVIARDGPLLPPEVWAFPSRSDVLRVMPEVLMVGWNVRGRRRTVVEAALRHAVSVGSWQSLVHELGLADAEAVELLVTMVECAARGRGLPAV
jgi:AcrR family transcriptional regulator